MVHGLKMLGTIVALVALTPLAGVATPRERHASATAARAVEHEKININTADVKALMTLDGVGRKLAEKIVEYRGAHGPFKRADEIRKVDGLGAALWEKNRERLVVK